MTGEIIVYAICLLALLGACYAWYLRIREKLLPWTAVAKDMRVYLDGEVLYLFNLIGKAGDKFIFGRELIEKINSKKNIEENMNRLLANILIHMDLPVKNVDLFIVYSNDDRFEQSNYTAGRFRQTNYNNWEIELNLKKDYNFWNIAAILCHECAHYYMYRHNITARPKMDNEKLTDITAVFLGFGDTMEKGYSESRKEKAASFSGTKIYASRIGYIKVPEISYVKRSIKKVERDLIMQVNEREEAIKKQMKFQEKLAEKQKELREKISTADELHRGLLNLADSVKSNLKNLNSIDADELQTFQDIYIAIERNDIAVMITELRNNLNSIRGLNELTQEIEKTDNLCAKLCRWNSLLGKKC